MAPIPHVHKKKKDDADTIRRYMSNGGSSGVPDLTGYAQESWVGDNFVAKEFFRSMFRAYDSNGVEIEPNNDGDEPYTIDNIKAMVGFWTNEYISALGQGSGGGGGGGSTSLAGLTDVAINPQTLAGGQALVYNGTTHKWENGSAVINMASVWSALGASTNEQINASHLSAALQGFATQEWVSQNYISIAYFDRLFRAYNGNTLVSHNDETSTIDNIKAMFGFWTEQYLSALGNSGGGSVSLTLANMGDVSLNNLADGQILVYDATEGKWVNTSASIVGNYLPLTGGTLTGDLFFAGYNNRVFGIKRTSASAGQDVANNIDVGWDYNNRDGAGAFFRSVEAGTLAGDFGFFARNATNQCELLGKPDGTLTWGNANVLTSANVKTINGESIYGTGNISVGGTGGDADTVDGYHASSLGIIYTYSIPASGCVRISFDNRFAAIISVRKNNSSGGLILIGNGYGANLIRNTWTQLSPTTSLRWSVPASDSIDKAIEIQNNSSSAANVEVTMLNSAVPTFSSVSSLYSTGDNIPIATANSNVASATKLETSRSLWGQSFDGSSNVDGNITVNGTSGTDTTVLINGVANNTNCFKVVGSQYSMYFGIGSGNVNRGIYDSTGGKWALYFNASNTILNYGNVGIGTTSPNYKLHVNGTLGAGNTSVANLESEGYVSALSDIRKKEVVEHMDGLTIEQIASMPIIKFTWKDRPEEGLQVGSVAQAWQKILPQSVHKSKNDYLSFSYGVAALVGTISNSRELMKHDARLSKIEKLLNINIE